MKVSELFDYRYGSNLELCNLNQTGDIPFVSRTAKNNGVSARVALVDGAKLQPAGSISVALGGSVLESFLQPKPYYTGRDIGILIPKNELSDIEKLFYCLCIKTNAYRYSYGRQANKTLASLELPDIPAWVYSVNINKLPNIKFNSLPVIDTSNWKSFKYEDLFELQRGKSGNIPEDNDGKTPYISSSASNNGCVGYTNKEPDYNGNTITIANNGSVGEAFYQSVPFCGTSDVTVLIPKFMLTPNTALFLCSLIRLEKSKYSYGRKWGLERMRKSVIKLPVDSNGNPDWEWVENYMLRIVKSS